jgi:hypothetical protein
MFPPLKVIDGHSCQKKAKCPHFCYHYTQRTLYLLIPIFDKKMMAKECFVMDYARRIQKTTPCHQ